MSIFNSASALYCAIVYGNGYNARAPRLAFEPCVDANKVIARFSTKLTNH